MWSARETSDASPSVVILVTRKIVMKLKHISPEWRKISLRTRGIFRRTDEEWIWGQWRLIRIFNLAEQAIQALESGRQWWRQWGRRGWFQSKIPTRPLRGGFYLRSHWTRTRPYDADDEDEEELLSDEDNSGQMGDFRDDSFNYD